MTAYRQSHPPALSSPYYFWIPENSDTLKASPTRLSISVDKNCSTGTRDNLSLFPLLSINSLFHRYENFCETQKGSPMRFFGTVRRTVFQRKIFLFPPLSSIFFELPEVSETDHKRFPSKSFWLPRDRKFPMKTRDITLPGKKFSFSKISDTLQDSLTSFFSTVR